MALGTNKLVVEDTPSEVVRLTRKTLNDLLDMVDAIVQAGIDNSGDGDSLATALAALDTSDLRKVVTSRERPSPPSAD